MVGLSWEGADGQRQNGRVRLSPKLRKMARKQLLCRWGVFGCAQSHGCALQKALQLFGQGYTAVLVFEDDAVMNPKTTVADASQRINMVLAFLTKTHPDWKLLLLGGQAQNVRNFQDLKARDVVL